MDRKDISKKDQIILQQLDVIRTMTENNLGRMGTDFWGHPAAPPETAKPQTPDAPSPVSPPRTGGEKGGAGNYAASTGNDDTRAPEQTASPPEKIEDLQSELGAISAHRH